LINFSASEATETYASVIYETPDMAEQ